MNVDSLFPTKYIKPIDLQGRDVTLTIKRTSLEMMGQGPEKEQKMVVWFEKTEKGLIMNRTNATVISTLYGKETDDWKGKKIIIYATSVKAFGKTQEAIRIRERVPAPVIAKASAPEPEPELHDPEDYLDMEVDDGNDEAVAEQGALMDEPVRNPFNDGIPFWKAALISLPKEANELVGFATALHRKSDGESTLEDYKKLKGLIFPLCAKSRALASDVLSILCQTEISESNRTGVNLTKTLIKYLSPTLLDDKGEPQNNPDYQVKMAAAIKAIAQHQPVKEPA